MIANVKLHDEATLDAFRCPDPSGVNAPCSHQALTEDGPRIVLDQDCFPTICPVYLTTPCVPWRRHQEVKGQQARREWVDAGIAAGIPRRFLDAILDAPHSTEALKYVREFLGTRAQEGDALVMLGPPGVGKSFAAAAAVRAWGRGARFVATETFLSRIHDSEHKRGALKEAESAALLVLDDLGRGHMSRFAVAMVEQLLASRYAERRTTIVTSNWTPLELREALSPRIVGRLKQWAVVVVAKGQNLREIPIPTAT